MKLVAVAAVAADVERGTLAERLVRHEAQALAARQRLPSVLRALR